MEVCCVCLDSLSSAPVVALLTDGARCGASCAHYLHACCAARLRTSTCPLCRTAFKAPSAPISRSRLANASPREVLAGLHLLVAGRSGRSAATTTLPRAVPARRTVELLAAVLPIRQASLEECVSQAIASLGNDQGLEVAGLANVLTQLGLGRTAPRGDAAQLASGLTVPRQYSWTTWLARSLMRVLLRATGAAGAAVQFACWGICSGAVLGMLAAIPKLRLARIMENIMEEDDAEDWRAFLIGIAIVCASQLVWHSFKDPRWVKYSGRWGAVLGALFGWLHALATVDPENHGFRSVFWLGLTGRPTWQTFFGAWEPVGSTAERIDIFVAEQ